jgi:hypothetical protein
MPARLVLAGNAQSCSNDQLCGWRTAEQNLDAQGVYTVPVTDEIGVGTREDIEN